MILGACAGLEHGDGKPEEPGGGDVATSDHLHPNGSCDEVFSGNPDSVKAVSAFFPTPDASHLLSEQDLTVPSMAKPSVQLCDSSLC